MDSGDETVSDRLGVAVLVGERKEAGSLHSTRGDGETVNFQDLMFYLSSFLELKPWTGITAMPTPQPHVAGETVLSTPLSR